MKMCIIALVGGFPFFFLCSVRKYFSDQLSEIFFFYYFHPLHKLRYDDVDALPLQPTPAKPIAA